MPVCSLPRRPTSTKAWRLPVTAANSVIIGAQFWASLAAWAFDIEPKDYIPAPSGTNLIALYSLFEDYGPLNIAGGPTIGGNTGVRSELEVLRYIYYGDITGRSFALQFVLPAGTAHGEIAGQKLQATGGIGDVLLAAGVSLLPYPEPDMNIGIVSYTSLPTGSYAPARQLNLGANRWGEDVQLGYTQGVGEKLWFDFAVDVGVFGANPQAGPSHQPLVQQPTYQLQSWLSYIISPTSLASFGAAALLGGTQTLGGAPNGVKTQSQQIRAAYTQVISPSFQLLGSVAHDVNTVGGFKQTFGVTLRAAYFF